jgi:hypothetical protein
MQFHDLDSVKWKQYAERKSFPLEIDLSRSKTALRYERKLARGFSHSPVCIAAELADFARLFPGVAVPLVGKGVDLDYFRPAGSETRPGSMAFTGTMDYLPNVDAVAWFAKKCCRGSRCKFPRQA